ncbi:MAG: hypothetical protein COV43_01820 [Deltaproteobacteria bacterium CG11_big_fil_rev_8_21_14_0_20_42_23]|nr:MAG: hypothetical protein COV43_01820 [Deltaproteobacteria bacterium CG11_big_fil_rev_8_21_14_0_20_42_23]
MQVTKYMPAQKDMAVFLLVIKVRFNVIKKMSGQGVFKFILSMKDVIVFQARLKTTLNEPEMGIEPTTY